MTTEQISAWTGIGTCVGLIVVGILNRLDARRDRLDAKKAQVAVDLAAGEARGAKIVASATHDLVNSNMGRQIYSKWQALDQLALAKPTPENIAAARAAEAEYADHQKKQAVVDSSKK